MFTRLILTITVSALPAMVLSGEPAKMNAKIKVQERIIETILETEPTLEFKAEAEGLYLSGFGVVFTVKIEPDRDYFIYNFAFGEALPALPALPAAPEVDYERALAEAEKALEKTTRELEKKEKEIDKANRTIEIYKSAMKEYVDTFKKNIKRDDEDRVKKLKTRIEGLQENLKDYLADYGPALNLPSREALLIKAQIADIHISAEIPRGYEISVSGADLAKLRAGRTGRESFIKSIRVEMKTGEERLPSDIQIMENILRTTFEEGKRDDYLAKYLDGSRSWAAYFPDYGVVFLQKCDPGHRFISFAPSDGIEWNECNIIIDEEKGDDRYKKAETAVARMQEDICDKLATYGATLKTVKPEEKVVVVIKFRRAFDRDKHSMLVFSAEKKIFLTYTKPEEIKKRIEVVKF